MPAYNAWTDEANATLADGEPAYVRAQAIRTLTTLGWQNILRVARGETTIEAALEEELAVLLPPRSADGIIGLSAVAKLLGISTQHAKALTDGTHHEGFPTAVATIEGVRAYLVQDIRTYQRGASFLKRTEGELQAQFMDARELEARMGMNHQVLWRCIHDARWDRIPQPEGFVSKKVAYWRREKAERWLAAQGDAGRQGGG